MRHSVIAISCALVLLATAAASAAALAPLVIDWDRYFDVEVQPSPPGGRAVSGTVWNTSGWGAKRIQLLVEALDPSGAVLEQKVVWLGLDLPPGQHARFDVPVAAPSASYRVSVFAFDSGRRR